MNEYSYDFPESLIAKRPASPRDSSRLFVYDTASDEIVLDHFFNIDNYFPPSSLLVLNDTKVMPARGMLRKETGGKIEVLFLINEWDRKGPLPAIVDRKVNVGDSLFFGDKYRFKIVGQEENIFFLVPQFSPAKFYALLDEKGITPIPKYIKGTNLPERELRKRYQTIFSKVPSSVAAPTASLHFTERVFKKLDAHGVRRATLTLGVGLGTFAPVTEENLKTGTLHYEPVQIPARSRTLIREHKRAGKPVIAAGTTAVRGLESQASKILLPAGEGAIIAKTNMFIHPPYRFKIVDALITNFHLPGTSLVMLVEALLRNKKAKRSVTDLYKIAVREKFRFYSFGDAMFIR